MITVLKKGTSKKKIQKTLEKIFNELSTQGIDAYAHCGKLKLKKDALETQRTLRDEWE